MEAMSRTQEAPRRITAAVEEAHSLASLLERSGFDPKVHGPILSELSQDGRLFVQEEGRLRSILGPEAVERLARGREVQIVTVKAEMHSSRYSRHESYYNGKAYRSLPDRFRKVGIVMAHGHESETRTAKVKIERSTVSSFLSLAVGVPKARGLPSALEINGDVALLSDHYASARHETERAFWGFFTHGYRRFSSASAQSDSRGAF